MSENRGRLLLYTFRRLVLSDQQSRVFYAFVYDTQKFEMLAFEKLQ